MVCLQAGLRAARAVPWSTYAFDPAERPIVGRPTREWPAIGATEAAVVRTMATALREISEGRVPR